MKNLITILCLCLFWGSCDQGEVHGCMDSQSCNYNPDSTIDNNSCLYLDECGECGGDDESKDDCGICPGESLCSEEYVGLWCECYDIQTTTDLLLSGNELTGEIPPEIGNLTNLTYLSLGNNQLTGVIPEEICNQGDSTPSVENNQLCPPYPECISQDDIDSQDTSNCP